MKAAALIASCIVIALAAAAIVGTLAVPPIMVDRMQHSLPNVNRAVAKSAVALLYFAPAFVLAAIVTSLVVLLVGRRSRALTILASVSAVLIFPFSQVTIISVLTAAMGSVWLNPVVHVIIACLAGVVFAPLCALVAVALRLPQARVG